MLQPFTRKADYDVNSNFLTKLPMNQRYRNHQSEAHLLKKNEVEASKRGKKNMDQIKRFKKYLEAEEANTQAQLLHKNAQTTRQATDCEMHGSLENLKDSILEQSTELESNGLAGPSQKTGYDQQQTPAEHVGAFGKSKSAQRMIQKNNRSNLYSNQKSDTMSIQSIENNVQIFNANYCRTPMKSGNREREMNETTQLNMSGVLSGSNSNAQKVRRLSIERLPDLSSQMSGEGIINKRYNLTPAAGSSIFKPVDKLNDEELRAVLNAPVNELRNRIKGKGQYTNGLHDRRWQSSSRTRIQMLNHHNRYTLGQTEVNQSHDMNFENNYILKNLKSNRGNDSIFAGNKGARSNPQVLSLDQATGRNYQILRNRVSEKKMSYFNMYLSPGQKRNILIHQKNAQNIRTYNKKYWTRQVSQPSMKLENQRLPSINSIKSVGTASVLPQQEADADFLNQSATKDSISKLQTLTQESALSVIDSTSNLHMAGRASVIAKTKTLDKQSEMRSPSRVSSLSRNRLSSPDKMERIKDSLKLQLNEIKLDKNTNNNKTKLHVSNILERNLLSQLQEEDDIEEQESSGESAFGDEDTKDWWKFQTEEREAIWQKFMLKVYKKYKINKDVPTMIELLDKQIQQQRDDSLKTECQSSVAEIKDGANANGKKTFEYKNHFVRDRQELNELSSDIALLYRKSQKKQQKNQKDKVKFDLDSIFDDQQKRNYCQIRTFIQKKFLAPHLGQRGGDDSTSDGSSQKMKWNSAQVRSCDHNYGQNENEFEINISDEFQKQLQQLKEMKHQKINKRELYDKLQKEEIALRSYNETKAKQKALFIKQQTKRTEFKRPGPLSLVGTGTSQRNLNLVANVMKNMNTEQMLEYQDKIFNKLCLMQKNKNDSDLDKDEIEAYQLLEAKPNDSIISLGNAVPTGFANFSINQNINIDTKFYRELIDLEAKLQGHQIDKSGINGIMTQLYKSSNFSMSYDQIEDSYETMQSQNIFKLKALREKQVALKLAKIEQKKKDEAQRNRYPGNWPVKETKSKTVEDIVIKAVSQSLQSQIVMDQGFEHDRRDDFVLGAGKEQEYILQSFANKQQYYKDVKKGISNPEVVDSLNMKYYKNASKRTSSKIKKNDIGLEGQCLVRPKFCNIVNGVLNLSNQDLSLQECEALKSFLINSVQPDQDPQSRVYNEIRVLLIDDSKFTDEMFSIILQGVDSQHCQLEQLIYLNGELGDKSIEQMINTMLVRQKKLRQICFTNLKNQMQFKEHYDYLFESISIQKLKSFKFTQMPILKEECVFKYIDEMLPNLQDVDLTWSCLTNSQSIQLGDALTRSTFLKSVNLSYLSVSNRNSKEEEDSFVKSLVQFISESVMLMHINLNGIGFNEAEIIDLVENGIAKSQSLVGAHLSGNQIRFGTELRARLCVSLGISQRADSNEQIPVGKKHKALSVKQLLETGNYSTDLINQSLINLFQQDREVHRATFTTSWSGGGIHDTARTNLKQPVTIVDDSFIIYRVLGNPELIFSDNPGLADEQWQLNSGKSKEEAFEKGLKDECYFCERHKHVQVYYSSHDRQKYYEQITDRLLLNTLKKQYEQELENATLPVILTSMSSKPTMHKMVNVKLFALYLLQNTIFESNINSKHLHVLKKNLKKELLAFIEGKYSDPVVEIKLSKIVGETMENWRTTFHQYMKHSNQYDSIQIGYPVLRTFMSEGFKDLDELHTGYTKYQLQSNDDDLASESVSNRDDDSLLAPDASQSSDCSSSIKKNEIDLEFTAGRDESSKAKQKDDRVASNEKCLNKLNSYLGSEHGQNFYIFTTFAKPGCHSIIIYDPITKEFYKKIQIITYKNDHSDPYSVAKVGVVADPMTIKSPTLRRQNEKLNKRQSKQAQEPDYFSIKPSVSIRDQLMPNYQQQEHTGQIFQEEISMIEYLDHGLAQQPACRSGSPTSRSQTQIAKQMSSNAIKEVDTIKQQLFKHFDFIINFHQFLRLKNDLGEYMEAYLRKHQNEQILPALGSRHVHQRAQPMEDKEDDQEKSVKLSPSLPVSEFINQILNCDKRPIDELIESMKHSAGLTWKMLRFIMFRKYEMNVKKESVHRCLAHNMETIDLLYQVYSSTNYESKDDNKQTFSHFLKDVEITYITHAKSDVKHASGISLERQNDAQFEMNLKSVLEKDLNGFNYEQLLRFCKVEQSLISHTDVQLNLEKKNDGEMNKLEFIELICRVAYVLDVTVKEFVANVLVELLREKHKHLWSKVPVHRSQIYKVLPKDLELPSFNEIPTRPANAGRVLAEGEARRDSAKFAIKALSSLQVGEQSAPVQLLRSLDDFRAGVVSAPGKWHVQHVQAQSRNTKALLQNIPENDESEDYD